MGRITIRLNEWDEESLQIGMARHPQMDNQSEYIRWLITQERFRQEQGNSKDAKLDDVLERLDCLYRLVVMLLMRQGMRPVEGTVEIPTEAIDGGRRTE